MQSISFGYNDSEAHLFANTFCLGDTENIFHTTGFAVLQVLQGRLDASQAAGDDFLPLRLEPTLLQCAGEVPEENEPKVLFCVVLVHAADVGHGPLNPLGDPLIILPGQHKGDLATLGRQHLADVDIAALLRHGVKSVQQLFAIKGFLETRDDGLVTISVVDDGVALGAVDDRLDMVLGPTGYADQGVNVALLGELDGVVAYCRSCAVDNQWSWLGCGSPGHGQAKAEVQADGCRHGCERNGCAFCVE